jgi:3-oxoacyl-ACP reductase-like protein
VAATPRAAQAAAPVAAAAPAAPAPKGALDIVVPAFLRRGRK